ncbi:helix-turn-helix domain-containing protein [Candidatus Dojkabacteria bacterium]|nr:helix-turn-helix domain-containing protein [Candidatus Dojkabacteria bacterium]
MKKCNISNKIMENIVEGVLHPASQNIMTVVYGIPGSGKTLNIQYILDNIKEISNDKSILNRTWIWFDLELINTESEFFNSISSQFSTLLGDSSKVESWSDLKSTVNSRFEDENFSLTLLIDNFEVIFGLDPDKKDMMSAFLYDIFSKNRDRISYVFLSAAEITDEKTSTLNRLSLLLQSATAYFMPFFDAESVDLLINWFETEQNCTISSDLQSKIKDLVAGDPRVILRCLYQSVINKDFTKSLLDSRDVSSSYMTIGKEYLNERYDSIIKGLSQVSVKELVELECNSESFINKMGLVIEKDDDFQYFSPLFGYYFMENKKEILNRQTEREVLSHSDNRGDSTINDNNIKLEQITDSKIKLLLSGQELLAFDFLSKNSGNVMTKEELAKNIWGDDWAEKYSVWALDKMLSRLKTKLNKHGYNKVVKVIKNRGVVLI